jgi:hypothetical protein
MRLTNPLRVLLSCFNVRRPLEMGKKKVKRCLDVSACRHELQVAVDLYFVSSVYSVFSLNTVCILGICIQPGSWVQPECIA